MDDRYIIDTPENIEFAYDIAGIGSRFLAAIIDSLVIGAVLLILAIITAIFSARSGAMGQRGGQPDRRDRRNPAFVLLGPTTSSSSWSGTARASASARSGCGSSARVASRSPYVSSAVRNLIRIVDFLPAFYGIGVIVMFVDRRARRLGDLAGGNAGGQRAPRRHARKPDGARDSHSHTPRRAGSAAHPAERPAAERSGLQSGPGILAPPQRAWARRAAPAGRSARQRAPGAAWPATGRRCRTLPPVCCQRIPATPATASAMIVNHKTQNVML